MPNKGNGPRAGARKVPGGPTGPGGVAGGRAARVSRVPLGLTQQPLIPANTKPLPGSGPALAPFTGARAPPGPDGWFGGGNERFRPGRGWWARRAWGGASVSPGEGSTAEWG